jgi:cytochrome b
VKRNTLVWDGLVRSFHILFGVGFLGAYLIAKFLGEDSSAFPYHMMLGLTIALMAGLRIIWLIAGTKWARITGLSLNPVELAQYMGSVFKKEAKQYAGHNPATSITLIVMLLLALSLAFTGYAYTQGNEAFEEIHPILANLFLFTVILHVAGVVLHSLVHRDGIVFGMVDGKKAVPDPDGLERGAPVAAVLFILASAFFCGSLFFSYNPSNATTRWPITGQVIQLGENEREGGGEQSGEYEEQENDD